MLRRKKPEGITHERGGGPLNPPRVRVYKKLKGKELVSEFV
jgi:hypothetical protein